MAFDGKHPLHPLRGFARGGLEGELAGGLSCVLATGFWAWQEDRSGPGTGWGWCVRACVRACACEREGGGGREGTV